MQQKLASSSRKMPPGGKQDAIRLPTSLQARFDQSRGSDPRKKSRLSILLQNRSNQETVSLPVDIFYKLTSWGVVYRTAGYRDHL
jgi:hypothetical protein